MRDDTGVWHDVAKAPATDPAKASKARRQAVVARDGRLTAARAGDVAEADDLLMPVWRNGALLVRHNFDAVRARTA